MKYVVSANKIVEFLHGYRTLNQIYNNTILTIIYLIKYECQKNRVY